METQIDITILGPKEEGRARWMVCDNGISVADGTACYDRANKGVTWETERPPAECEGRVRAEIDRIFTAAS